MKKTFLLLAALTMTGTFLYGQKPDALPAVQVPVDSITKLIAYEEVVSAAGMKAETFYRRAQSWFKTYYKNPGEVIRENDSTKFRIVGKPRFKIYNPKDKQGLATDGGLIQYTITVAAKDGRFKYELTEFNWKQQSYYPAERWLDTKSQTYTTAYAEYLRQLDHYAKELVASLKDAMLKEKPVKDKDKW